MVVTAIACGVTSLFLLWLAVEFEYKHNRIKYLLIASSTIMLIIFVSCALKFWTTFSPFEMATFALIYVGLVVDSNVEKMTEMQVERITYLMAILLALVCITLVLGILNQ